MTARNREAHLVNPSAEQLRNALDAAQSAAQQAKGCSVEQLLTTLDRVIVSWLEPSSEWLQRAQDMLPEVTGFSRAMVGHGLRRFLEPLRRDAVRSLMDRELGDHCVLDGARHGRRAVGPRLIAHVLAGNIPGLAAAPIVLSLALKSATLIKAAAHDPIFPALFAASIRAVDPSLARCLVVGQWRGGDTSLDAVAFSNADLVVASGSDATIAAISARVTGRFIGHGHKVSFAVIGGDCLSRAETAHELARRLAYDVCLWDQYGCLSPQLCFIESGAAITLERFAHMLAQALTDCATELPPRTLSLDEKAAVLRFRQETEWDGRRKLLASPTSTDWTISIEPDAEFLPSCLNRCLRLKTLPDLNALRSVLAPHRRHLEAAGLAVGSGRAARVETTLAESGVHRVCAIGAMQTPTLGWRQGGRPRIADWVEWSEVENGNR